MTIFYYIANHLKDLKDIFHIANNFIDEDLEI